MITTLDLTPPFESVEPADTRVPDLVGLFSEVIVSTRDVHRPFGPQRRAELLRRLAERSLRQDGLDWQTLARMDEQWGIDETP
jgi:hypothetical protein